MKGVSLDEARAAKARATKEFRGVGEVVGVGLVSLGDGYGLKVNLAEAPAEGASVPKDIDGVPVRVEVVGTITKR